MFGVDFEDADNTNVSQGGFDGENSRSASSFGTRSAYRGTVALKTLRRPKVKTLRQAYTTVGEEQIVLAEDAGLEELLALYKHDHAKVKGLASAALAHLTSNAEDEVVVAAKEGFAPLFELLEIKDEDVRAKATMTLSILAEQPDSQELIVEAAGGWNKIIPLVRSNNTSVQHAGLLLCGSLVINSELREAFIKEGGVGQVLKAAGAKDIKVQRALATCLANLAQEAEAVKDVIGGDGLKKVLAWIGQGDEELTGSSVSILANASNNEHFKEPLLQGRVLDVVPPLLLSENETVRTGTLILLSNLSTVEEANVLVATTCLDNLLKVAKTTDNTDYLYRTVVCFSNLASFDQSRQKIKEKGIDAYLKHLHANHKDPDIHKEVTQALAELGEFVKAAVDDGDDSDEKEDDDDKGVKEELKAQVKSLVERLETETKESELEKITAELQQVLLHKKESHNILWLKNGVAALVEHIAKGGDAPATPSQVNAVRALAELARYRKNRVRIGNSQAIPPLLKHLKNSSGNPQLALAALFILEDITQKDTLLENFRLAKPLDALMVQLVGGGEVAHEDVQANCLTLIQRTVKNHVPSQVGFRVLSGFDILVRLLASPSPKVKELAAYALGAACSGQRRMQQAAAKAKAIKSLTALLQPKEDLRVRLAACSAIGQVIQQDQANQEKLRKQSGAVEAVIELFSVAGSTPDPKQPQGPTLEQQVQWVALYTAGNFVYLYSKGQNAIRAKKGIPVIIEFVKSTNAAVTVGLKEQATRLLCYMCFYNNKNQELIGTPAVASAIVENLALDSKRLQYYTEGLIWSLAHNSKKRRATLIDAGAIGALLELAQSPSEAVAKGAEWAKQALVKK